MKCVKGRTFSEVMRKKHDLEVYANYVQCELKPHWTDCCFGQATLSWFVSALSKEIIRSPTERWLLKKGLMYQSIPKPPIPPRAIPGHLTRVKFRTVGNLTQNEARPVGHLTFVSKRLSAVGSKRISQLFDSAGEPRSRVIAVVDSTWVFLLLSFYIVLSWNMPLFKVWSEDKLNKKFVVAENFAELVSRVALTCLEGGGFDPLWSSNGWGIWPSKVAI